MTLQRDPNVGFYNGIYQANLTKPWEACSQFGDVFLKGVEYPMTGYMVNNQCSFGLGIHLFPWHPNNAWDEVVYHYFGQFDGPGYIEDQFVDTDPLHLQNGGGYWKATIPDPVTCNAWGYPEQISIIVHWFMDD